MFDRFKKEIVFEIPDVRRANERAPKPQAVKRHYLVMQKAMSEGDKRLVANHQLRLLRGGFEVPITLSQCEKLLERFDAT